MRRHALLLAILVLAGCASFNEPAQWWHGELILAVDDYTLQGGEVKVPGQGRSLSGIDLLSGKAKHKLGDPPDAAAQVPIDSTWRFLSDGKHDTVASPAVHWVRRALQPDSTRSELPILVNVSARYPYILYLNGTVVGRQVAAQIAADDQSVPVQQVALVLHPDTLPSILALKVEGPAGIPFAELDVSLTMHAVGLHHAVHRTMVHQGLFIGINLIIVLLALVIGRGDRERRSWDLLALLSLLGVLSLLSSLVGDGQLLGGPYAVRRWATNLGVMAAPWPPYLLLMVLGSMAGGLSAKRRRWYLNATIVLSVIVLLLVVLRSMHFPVDGSLLVILLDYWYIVLPGLLVALLYGTVAVWFFIDVVRLSIKLLRKPGYTRWVGGGALASGLGALLLSAVSNLFRQDVRSWIELASNYLGFVGLPVSIAVYMAIRSAHHNRLMARQRDELDEEVKERTAELRSERDRSEELLLNILPAEVADELKAKGQADAVQLDEVTVLFTDFKGFTTLSSSMAPADLVKDLNECFSAFDLITEQYGIEKIKTIGDAYMAAGGLPKPNTTHALDTVRAALAMRDFINEGMQRKRAAGLPYFEVRIGVHTGPAVAGIVGLKKFQYDIWGDTVNTASRMEATGQEGKVNISASTYALVKDAVEIPDGRPAFQFEPRGTIEVKGKGGVEMYFVEWGGSCEP